MRGVHLTGLLGLKMGWLSNMPNTWAVETPDDYGHPTKDAKFSPLTTPRQIGEVLDTML